MAYVVDNCFYNTVTFLSQVAFHTVNPFPMRGIASKRQFYYLQVKVSDEMCAFSALFIGDEYF